MEPTGPTRATRDAGLLTEQEAAAALNISLTYLRRLRRLGLVPAILLPSARGRRPTVRYSPAELRAWLERRRSGRAWRF